MFLKEVLLILNQAGQDPPSWHFHANWLQLIETPLCNISKTWPDFRATSDWDEVASVIIATVASSRPILDRCARERRCEKETEERIKGNGKREKISMETTQVPFHGR